ncbi:MAG: response regulator, partial [Alphaproteobacteria bacterium]
KVVQYRNSLMYLANLDPNYQIPSEGAQQLVVFNDKDKILGLIVKEIVDIVENSIEVLNPASDDESFFGAMVIEGKTTDLIDIKYYFRQIFKDHFDAANEDQDKLGNILLIDDSPFFRKFIPPALVAKGYEVITVENAQKALELLDKNHNFTAIVTDINMPVISGIEFAEICKDYPHLKDIPIIALSSNSTDNVHRIDNRLFYEFIAKTNSDRLIEAVSEIYNSGDKVKAYEQ